MNTEIYRGRQSKLERERGRERERECGVVGERATKREPEGKRDYEIFSC
jgi:hypothetical protein